MTKKLTAGLASIATMAGLLWSMPADTGTPAWAPPDHPVRYWHNKFPGGTAAAAACRDNNGPDGDRDCDDETTPRELPEPGTLALLALGLGGLGLPALRGRRPRE